MDIQWPLLIFGLFAGLGMGCLGFVCVAELTNKAKSLRMPGLIISLVALGVGGLASALHMGNPTRILYILENLSSGITQELIVTAFAGIIIIALMIAIGRNASTGVTKTLAVFGLVVAVILPFVTGEAYVQGARPAWNTLFLPIMYVGAACAMGMFAMYLVAAVKKAELVTIAKITFFASAVFGITVFAYLVAVATSTYPDPSRSIDRLISGDLALIFWLFVVVLGILLPLFISVVGAFYNKADRQPALLALRNPGVIAVGFICIMTGSTAIRMLMYLLGSSVQSFIY